LLALLDDVLAEPERARARATLHEFGLLPAA
jgi:hypothetical protein